MGNAVGTGIAKTTLPHSVHAGENSLFRAFFASVNARRFYNYRFGGRRGTRGGHSRRRGRGGRRGGSLRLRLRLREAIHYGGRDSHRGNGRSRRVVGNHTLLVRDASVFCQAVGTKRSRSGLCSLISAAYVTRNLGTSAGVIVVDTLLSLRTGHPDPHVEIAQIGAVGSVQRTVVHATTCAVVANIVGRRGVDQIGLIDVLIDILRDDLTLLQIDLLSRPSARSDEQNDDKRDRNQAVVCKRIATWHLGRTFFSYSIVCCNVVAVAVLNAAT